MNTHDIELPPLPKASKMYDIPGYDEEELKDYAIAAIEADRKRRREPTAAEISNVVREITGCPDIKSGEKSLVVALGMLFHTYAAPQPAEPVKCIGCEGKPAPENNPCAVCGKEAESAAAEFPVKGKLHGPLGWIANTTNPEPVKVPTPAQTRRARLRADPVKAAALDRAKERIAAELANSADPVKVPSDSAIMFEWSQTPNTGDMRVDLVAFARALLARYGKGTP